MRSEMKNLGRPEEFLENAHRLIAGTLAPINFCLQRRRLSKSALRECIIRLRYAADALEELIDA